jgi:sec-independent protein translocase protein TatB
VFNIGPLELLVLAIVGLVVLGPERLPGLARDAARMVKTLRELATGARQQLRDELGPEFSDVDLRNLNPRAAVQRAVFGDEVDLTKYHPRRMVQDMLLGDDDSDDERPSRPTGSGGSSAGPSSNGAVSMRKSADSADAPTATPYDDDAT